MRESTAPEIVPVDCVMAPVPSAVRLTVPVAPMFAPIAMPPLLEVVTVTFNPDNVPLTLSAPSRSKLKLPAPELDSPSVVVPVFVS